MGSIYQRKGSRYLWIQYYDGRGTVMRESTRSEKREVAKRLLRKREGEIAEGRTPGLYFDKVMLRELADDFLDDYITNGKRSRVRAEQHVRQLLDHFTGAKAVEITTARVKQYTRVRMNAGAANGTINRELAALKRMFRLGSICTPPKVAAKPHIPMLEEPPAKTDFFETEEFYTFREHLPTHLQGIVIFGFKLGCRLGELQNLKWKNVNRDEGYIRLGGGDTKNKTGRNIYLDQEGREVLRQQYLKQHIGCPLVFHRGGKLIKDFRGAWNKACAAIGRTGYSDGGQQEEEREPLTFHSLRRTSVRNMIRAGVPETIAMKISGHKTRSVFDRYNIVNDDDLRQAADKLSAFIAGSRA